jgi:hypothetical protein
MLIIYASIYVNVIYIFLIILVCICICQCDIFLAKFGF